MANQKDVIYVDTDDDITAVIAKVKKSESRVIALVPPKRANMLSSVVNLRLLKRAAEEDDKKIVLITTEGVLTSMAGGIAMFVAKDLKTPPSVPKVESANLPSNVIESESVVAPVPIPQDAPETADSLAGKAAVASAATKSDAVAAKTNKASKTKDGKKVPDIKRFRKLMLIGGGLLILLLLGLWWAIFIAPKADVVLRAQTEDIPIESDVNLSTNVGTFEETTNTVPATRQTIEEDLSADFEATGEKDVGKKATGTVRLSKLSAGETTVPAGTQITSSGGKTYTTDQNAVIPASTPCFPTFCAESTEVGITATETGKEYNGASGSASGAPSGVNANITGATKGGTSKIVTVVDQSDIDQAKAEMEPKSKSAAIEELKAKFDDEELIVFEDTYQTETSNESSSAKAGEEADNGTVKQTVTHSLFAISQKDYEALIDSLAEDKLDEGLKVFDYAEDTAKISVTDSGGYNLDVTVKAGPDIDFDKLASKLAGQRFSAAIAIAEREEGVNKAEIDLQPFWVFSVPKNTEKINITIEQPESN